MHAQLHSKAVAGESGYSGVEFPGLVQQAGFWDLKQEVKGEKMMKMQRISNMKGEFMKWLRRHTPYNLGHKANSVSKAVEFLFRLA